MFMYRFIFLLFFMQTIIFFPETFAKEIAFSFDDAPTEDSFLMTGKQRTSLILETLKKHRIDQVAIFVTTKYLKNKDGYDRVKLYDSKNHLIANHSDQHMKIEKLGVIGYAHDLTKAHNDLKTFKNFFPYFRPPFLDYGQTSSIIHQIEQVYKKLGYRNGYVTIDTSDWYMNTLIQKVFRRGDFQKIEKCGNAYISAIWQSVKFYDDLATKLVSRPLRHVILLHENDAAAIYLDKLIKEFKKNDWNIISPKLAYEDSHVFDKIKTIKRNDGVIASIAADQEYQGDIRDPMQEVKNVEAYFRVFGCY